ncbi:MAG: argininosuccinate lyase [Chloroflexi bacterium]|nr:argininosuccinate lyase [Chloroflexota bacterium]
MTSPVASFPNPIYSKFVLQRAYRDAQTYFFEPLMAANEAHVLMLVQCDIIEPENGVAILQAVERIREEGPNAYDYQPGVEDLFFRIESRIIELAGANYGGNLQLARSRNDLGHALARLALRDEILALFADLLGLRAAMLHQARRHLHTLMPGYTHTQPAQPVTFAHYLAGALTLLAAEQKRIQQAFANINRSPLGAVAFTGTGFPINRKLVADLLGFDEVIVSSQHSIGGHDYLTDIAFSLQSLAIGLSRITHDLLMRSTREANALRVDDSFIQISSIMPQKRNPVVLEHLRARLSQVIGYAAAVALQCHNIPYGDTQDIEDEIFPPLMHALTAARESLQIYQTFFETLTLNEAHLRRQAGEGFTTASELADTLVREVGLSFRVAHQIVSKMVQKAVQEGLDFHDLTLALLQRSAQEIIGRSLPLTPTAFERALDPEHFIACRRTLGGVAPEATDALLKQLATEWRADKTWLERTRQRLAKADRRRRANVEKLLQRVVTRLSG